MLVAASLAGCNAIAGIAPATERDVDVGVPDDAGDSAADDTGGDDVAEDEVDVAAPCVAIGIGPLPKNGGAACPAETGTCYPHDLTSWSPSWHPAVGAKLGKCSDTQIDDYFAACRSSTWSQPKCTSFGKANVDCTQCLESNIASARYGVAVFGYQTNWLNIAGCVALVEPCNQPCAEALNALQQCSMTACDAYCTLTTQAAAGACESSSWTCATCQELEPLAGCMAQISGVDHPAYKTCGLGELSDPQKVFTDLARFMCGS